MSGVTTGSQGWATRGPTTAHAWSECQPLVLMSQPPLGVSYTRPCSTGHFGPMTIEHLLKCVYSKAISMKDIHLKGGSMPLLVIIFHTSIRDQKKIIYICIYIKCIKSFIHVSRVYFMLMAVYSLSSTNVFTLLIPGTIHFINVCHPINPQ